MPISTPIWMSRPCSVKIFQQAFETDSSHAARKSGIASSIVTCEPSLRQTDPSSSPITPAPITPRRLGMLSKASAPSLSHTSTLSTVTPSRCRAFDPVARITLRASFRSTSSPSLTSTRWNPSAEPAKHPCPLSQSILFLRNRNSIPFVIFWTIASLRAIIFATSTATPLAVMPCSCRCREAFSNCSDDASSAFDGMHPTFRQVPPRAILPSGLRHFSTHATLNPSCAARIAAM